MDFSSKEAIVASVKSMFELLRESEVVKDLLDKEDDDEMQQQTVGRVLLANKDETSPGRLAQLVVMELEKAAKKAKISADGGRVYIDCPYEERDEAKALGAKWDWQRKKWYVPGGLDVAEFSKWM